MGHIMWDITHPHVLAEKTSIHTFKVITCRPHLHIHTPVITVSLIAALHQAQLHNRAS